MVLRRIRSKTWKGDDSGRDFHSDALLSNVNNAESHFENLVNLT